MRFWISFVSLLRVPGRVKGPEGGKQTGRASPAIRRTADSAGSHAGATGGRGEPHEVLLHGASVGARPANFSFSMTVPDD